MLQPLPSLIPSLTLLLRPSPLPSPTQSLPLPPTLPLRLLLKPSLPVQTLLKPRPPLPKLSHQKPQSHL